MIIKIFLEMNQWKEIINTFIQGTLWWLNRSMSWMTRRKFHPWDPRGRVRENWLLQTVLWSPYTCQVYPLLSKNKYSIRKLRIWVWRAMAPWLEHWLLFLRTRVQFVAPTWQITTFLTPVLGVWCPLLALAGIAQHGCTSIHLGNMLIHIEKKHKK